MCGQNTIEEKILFIDDDTDIREIIEKFIIHMGYKVTVAKDASDALSILTSEEFPLIITDLKMPGISGTQLCKEIRKVNQTSIIYALSGHLTTFNLDALTEIGFDGHLCKPISFNSFNQAIRGAFDKIKRA